MPRISQKKKSEGGIQSVTLALQIIEVLAFADRPQGVTELAKALGTTKTRIFNYLQTLAEHGYAVQEPESERYRIPETLRGIDSPRNDAWNNKVLAYETVGKQGTLSCSPVGPGGSTGCLGQLIQKAYAEKGMDGQLKFSELIAAERAKRLSTIDSEAAETQARVEEAEKDYEARQRAQQETPAPPPPAGQ